METEAQEGGGGGGTAPETASSFSCCEPPPAPPEAARLLTSSQETLGLTFNPLDQPTARLAEEFRSSDKPKNCHRNGPRGHRCSLGACCPAPSSVWDTFGQKSEAFLENVVNIEKTFFLF